MSFLMEHYELTVNLVVLTYSGMPSFYFIVLGLGLGSCKSKLYIIYMFLGNESGICNIFFFDYFIIHYWIGVVPVCVFRQHICIKCNNIVSYMINWQ